MLMFLIAWKIITRKRVVQEEMEKFLLLFYYLMKENIKELEELTALRFPCTG